MVDNSAAEFDEFYHARYGSLVRGLYLACGDWTRAEDAAQEAFVRAWRSWPTLVSSDPVAWVRTVAWRTCVDDWRKRSRLTRKLERLRDEAAISATPDQLDPAAEVLSTLSPALRAVAVLHYLEDLSVSQIAAVLDIPVGTVKSRLSRARDALREELSDTERKRQ